MSDVYISLDSNYVNVCPNDFYQLLTLHAVMTSPVFSLVYVLFVGKSTSDYNAFSKKGIIEQDNFLTSNRS
jgi:hypothetical protein